MLYHHRRQNPAMKIHSELLVIKVNSISKDSVPLENYTITNFIFNSLFRQMLEKKVNQHLALNEVVKVELVSQQRGDDVGST